MPPRNLPPRLKKPRRGYKNPSIPFYQSSKYQTPNINNPRPRKPYWPKVFSRKQFKPQNSGPYRKSVPPTSPINLSDSKKFLAMMSNVQPGVSVYIHGGIEEVIKRANIEGLVSHLSKKFYIYLMGEYYCNMRASRGLDGIIHFTTVINKKTILIDHRIISTVLNLPGTLAEKPCLDIYSYFIFNKSEFQLLIGTFCDTDVPLGLGEVNCIIHYKHFIPKYQYLALILRANILPKPNQSKFFDFYDMKLLHLIVTNSMDFNISHVILLNMINANLVDYMPYGLLLTSIFNMHNMSMPYMFTRFSDSQITLAHIRAQVPLIYCEPQIFLPTVIPPVLKEENIYLANCDSIKQMIEEQKVKIRRLKEENDEVKSTLKNLENLVGTQVGNNEVMDMEILSAFQVQIIDEKEEVKTELANEGLTDQEKTGKVPDFVGEMGFVAYLENSDV